MIVHVNGEPRELDDGATVAAVVEALAQRSRRGIAVAVDAEVIPRGRWAQRRLHDGARVEILTAVQGG